MLSRMRYLWRASLTASAFVAFYVGAALLTWFWLPLAGLRAEDAATR